MIQLHLITREQAQAAGLKRYYTGKPCKYNQYAERRTSNGCCLCFLHNALLKASSEKWRKENLDKRRESNRRFAIRQRTSPHNPTFEVKA